MAPSEDVSELPVEELDDIDPTALVADAQDHAAITFQTPRPGPGQTEAPFRGAQRARQVIEEQAAASDTIARRGMENDELANDYTRLINSNTAGTAEIERIGPPAMPSSEYGVLGKVSLAQVKRSGSIEEIVKSKYGGGDYIARFRLSDRTLANVPDHEFRVGGPPIMVSPDGERWEKAKLDAAKSGGTARAEGGESAAAMQMLTVMQRGLSEQAQAARDEQERLQNTFMAMVGEFRKTGDDESKLKMEELKNENAEKARIAGERIAKFEAEERTNREVRLKKLDEEAADRREAHELRLQREKSESDARLAREKAESDARLVQQQEEGRERRLMARLEIRAQMRRDELAATSGLGRKMHSKVFGGAMGSMLEAQSKKFRDDLGLDDEEDDSFVGILKGVVKDNAPMLVEKLLNGFGQQPQQQQYAPQPQYQPRPALPETIDVSASVAPSPAPAAPAPPAAAPSQMNSEGSINVNAPPTAQDDDLTPEQNAQINQMAMQAAIPTIHAFLGTLALMARTRPAPEAAWDMQVIADQGTLYDLFGRMPEGVRELFAKDAREFLTQMRQFGPTEVTAIAHALRDPKSAAWFNALIEIEPWNDEGDDEEDDEPETPQ